MEVSYNSWNVISTTDFGYECQTTNKQLLLCIQRSAIFDSLSLDEA